MDKFEKILLRLKEQLSVQSDKEVAELLGLSVKAFTARKARDSFPRDKLLALKASRPDLLIDDVYILTGQHLSVSQANQRVAQLAAEQYEVAESKLTPYVQAALRDEKLIEKINRLDESNKSVVEAMIDALLTKK